ncbi:MAG: hypothetical protein MI725_16180, partial [Pirellulales bacterium]|nr:hypothetical protein [Pirellulales bacterium]
PEIERIVFKQPQLWAARTAGGEWNLDSLLPLPPCGNNRPEIVIKDAQVAFTDLSRPALPQLALRDVDLTIGGSDEKSSPPISPQVHSVEFTGAPAPGGPILEVHGSFGGPNVRRAEIQARFDVPEKSLELQGRIEQLQLTKELQAWAIACCDKLTEKTSLEGKLDGNVTLRHQFLKDAQPQVDAHLQLSEGRLIDPRLPRPLSELAGSLVCQNGVLRIEGLRAKCDTASVALQMERRGWQTTAPLALGVRVEDLPLDKKLYRVLPPILQNEWNKYRPAGIVDADVQLTFDGRRWRPEALLTGRELAFESEKFKYRVHDGSGTMQYTPRTPDRPAVLDIDLIGYGGGQALKFVGQAFDPQPGALGWLEISGGGLEIEQRMIAALPEKTRRVIESLRPQGHFNVRWRLDRTQPGQVKPHTSLRLELLDCRVNYRKFPYPLSGIHGLVLAEDQQWRFRDLVAHGSRNVECQGELRPLGEGKELSLRFTGKQLPLDDDLKQALPAAVRKAWDEVRPGGRVDLIADVYHLTGYTKPAIRVSVHPRPETATIQPKFFPYLMKQVEGRFDYLNGKLWITDFRAEHGPTTLRTNGNGNFGEDGAWQVELTGMSVDRLELRRDLLAALPPKLHKLIEQLRLSGKFSLHNTELEFSKTSDPEAEVHSQWDMQLSCLQTDLHPGIDLENVHGTIRLQGASRGANSYSTGELALDTLTFEDVQFTNIRGPLWIDETSCLLGEWATQRQRETPRRITAKAYGGTLRGDGWVTFDGVPRYSLVAALHEADMLRLTKEGFNTEQDLQGKVAATLTLHGYGRSLHTLAGHGEVQVTEANIYELPLLVGMLKVLRNRTPDTTAFNQVNTKYRIQGRHIYLDQLDFLGDAVSLLGKGETNFDHQLNLVFHGVVGRNEIRLPLVKDFFEKVGESTYQLYVDGTLSEPQIHTQALPGINQLIQQIQTDLDATSPYSHGPPREAQRSLPTPPR